MPLVLSNWLIIDLLLNYWKGRVKNNTVFIMCDELYFINEEGKQMSHIVIKYISFWIAK